MYYVNGKNKVRAPSKAMCPPRIGKINTRPNLIFLKRVE